MRCSHALNAPSDLGPDGCRSSSLWRGFYGISVMRRQFVACVLLMSCAAVSGWKARDFHDARSCAYLAATPPIYKGYISRLPAIAREVPPSVIADIYRCWSLHPQTTMGRPLRLEDARQLNRTTDMLAFGEWGVSDASLLFVVDADGTVRAAYTYPYTL